MAGGRRCRGWATGSNSWPSEKNGCFFIKPSQAPNDAVLGSDNAYARRCARGLAAWPWPHHVVQLGCFPSHLSFFFGCHMVAPDAVLASKVFPNLRTTFTHPINSCLIANFTPIERMNVTEILLVICAKERYISDIYLRLIQQYLMELLVCLAVLICDHLC